MINIVSKKNFDSGFLLSNEGYDVWMGNFRGNVYSRNHTIFDPDLIVGPFWDEERKYLDKKYKTIPFPFIEIESPRFEQEYQWTFAHLIGYLKTWSAVKHYEKANGENPVALIEEELKATFGAKNKVVFPILFRCGKLAK